MLISLAGAQERKWWKVHPVQAPAPPSIVLTFTECAAVPRRRGSFPPGGGLGPAFRSKTHAKIDWKSNAENYRNISQNETQNGAKMVSKTLKNALENQHRKLPPKYSIFELRGDPRTLEMCIFT